jgi:alkylation response protein AidB-like acyl-CoA dehydrogenase
MEVAKGNGSAGWSVMINFAPLLLHSWGEKVAREVLGHPHVGPRLAGTVFLTKGKAEARLVDGGYLVEGRWSFASNVWHCPWFMGNFAYIDAQGDEQQGMALMPRSELEIADDWHVEGLKGSGSNSAYTTREVFVPTERAITRAQFMSSMNGYIAAGVHVAACALVIGCAHGALDTFVESAPSRPGWRNTGTLASLASAQIAVAKLRAYIDTAERGLRAAAERHDDALASGAAVQADEAALLRYENTLLVHDVRRGLEELAIIIGSAASADTNPINRFIRDARTACLHGVLRPEPEGEMFGRIVLGLDEAQPRFSAKM